MQYYSHSKKDQYGLVKGSKLLRDHIEGVLNNALIRCEINDADFGSGYDINEVTTLIIKLHDLGKYTSYFQNYLLDIKPIDQILKRHAKIGGLVAYNFLKEKNERLALIAMYLIFLHHSKLTNINNIPGKLEDERLEIESQIQNLKTKITAIESDSGFIGLAALLEFPDQKLIRKAFGLWYKRNQNISNYFLINYLFSLLIEADKLDASDTPIYSLKSINPNTVDERFHVPPAVIERKDLKTLSNNELRNFCRKEVSKNIHKDDILDQYIFTLTAPTGIGKTMTALDFALKLKSKLKISTAREATIIYALPFINIIEQALDEYKKTLPGDLEIIAHYQYADVFGKEKEDIQFDGEELNYNQRLMSLDTWQGDIIITSFVQFFETLIGNRNKVLKKFNHLANSIIILDEVQTLKLDQMPLIGASLFYLAKFLKARIILMTATKPKIFELAQIHILGHEGETVKPLELLNCYEEVFSCFERTKIISLVNHEFRKDNIIGDFIENIFSKYWQDDKACLIVCNTVKRSIEIFEAIRTFLKENDLENPLEYLSTNIVPAHRFKRIQVIRKNLEDRLAPILVATQVVEAGVDLDFDMGFRDIGPIDSIIQVAGRINRSNNLLKKHSPLYVIDFGDARKIYGTITYEQSKRALSQQKEFMESEYLKLISKYFDDISEKKSFSSFNKIFESMKMLRYDSESSDDRPVSSFRIIEESNTTQSVFIELGDTEEKLKMDYLGKIKSKISKEEFDKNYKQDFQQRIITVPDRLTKELPFLNDFEQNIKLVSFNVLDQYYNIQTGFVRSSEESVTFF